MARPRVGEVIDQGGKQAKVLWIQDMELLHANGFTITRTLSAAFQEIDSGRVITAVLHTSTRHV